jgi:general secretion pathway protein M
MFSSMTPRQSRTLAAVILILLTVILMVLTVYPVWSMNRDYNTSIEDMQFQIQRYQRIARQDDHYQLEFNKIKRNQQTDVRYLQSKTDLLANAELQRRIKQVVASAQGEIISTQTVQISQGEILNKIGVRVRMKSTLENLVRILHQIETKKPYLFIENISQRSRHLSRRRLPANKKIEQEIKKLDLEFLVIGYIKRGDE